MKRFSSLSALICGIMLTSCEKIDFAGFLSISDAHVNDRFDASMKLLETKSVADLNVSSDEYVFHIVTDIHYDGTNDRLERFVSACADDSGTEKVVLCLGDFNSKRGVQSQIYAKLQPLYDAGWRFLPALGNHDIFFGEFDKFSKYWPLTTYTFKVNMPSGESDFFICLDTAEGSCGTSQRQWVENQLKTASGRYRNIYVYTHTNFFNTDNTQITSGNFSLEETHDLMSLFSSYGVSCVLTGHDHYFENCILREVSYYTLNALCNEPGSYYKAQFGKELQLTELTIE